MSDDTPDAGLTLTQQQRITLVAAVSESRDEGITPVYVAVQNMLAAEREAADRYRAAWYSAVERVRKASERADAAERERDQWRERMWVSVRERAVWMHEKGEHAGDLPFMHCPECERIEAAKRAEAAEAKIAALLENLIPFVETFETGEAAANALPIFLRALGDTEADR